MARIYFDNNATTAVAPEAREAMLPFLGERFGNPSSVHAHGQEARIALLAARETVAACLGAHADEIVFTGSGSESINTVLRGHAPGPPDRLRIVTCATEHPATLGTGKVLAQQGAQVQVLPVDRTGSLAPARFAEALVPGTTLAAVMLANNETGGLQPVRELAQATHARGALFLTDAVQAVGKVPVDVGDLGVDYLAVSAHKFHGPKGTGALYVRRGSPFTPLIVGGGQETGRRSGTENVAGIVGLAAALRLAVDRLENYRSQMLALTGRLLDGLRARLPAVRSNGPPDARLPNTLNLAIPGARADRLLIALDLEGISVSTGAACHSGSITASHVLLALGLTPEDANSSLRISLSRYNTVEEVDRFLEVLPALIARQRQGP